MCPLLLLQPITRKHSILFYSSSGGIAPSSLAINVTNEQTSCQKTHCTHAVTPGCSDMTPPPPLLGPICYNRLLAFCECRPISPVMPRWYFRACCAAFPKCASAPEPLAGRCSILYRRPNHFTIMLGTPSLLLIIDQVVGACVAPRAATWCAESERGGGGGSVSALMGWSTAGFLDC